MSPFFLPILIISISIGLNSSIANALDLFTFDAIHSRSIEFDESKDAKPINVHRLRTALNLGFPLLNKSMSSTWQLNLLGSLQQDTIKSDAPTDSSSLEQDFSMLGAHIDYQPSEKSPGWFILSRLTSGQKPLTNAPLTRWLLGTRLTPLFKLPYFETTIMAVQAKFYRNFNQYRVYVGGDIRVSESATAKILLPAYAYIALSGASLWEFGYEATDIYYQAHTVATQLMVSGFEARLFARWLTPISENLFWALECGSQLENASIYSDRGELVDKYSTIPSLYGKIALRYTPR